MTASPAVSGAERYSINNPSLNPYVARKAEAITFLLMVPGRGG